MTTHKSNKKKEDSKANVEGENKANVEGEKNKEDSKEEANVPEGEPKEFLDVSNFITYGAKFGKGVFDAITGFSMLFAWTVAFSFDGLRDIFRTKEERSERASKMKGKEQ